jgi:hypothetical protein
MGFRPGICPTYKTFANHLYNWDNARCDWLDERLKDGNVPDKTILSAKQIMLVGTIFLENLLTFGATHASIKVRSYL